MPDLQTSYLGIPLKSPLIVSSIPLNYDINQVKEMARAGAGAVILPSLFEEMLRLEERGVGEFHPKARMEIPPDLRPTAEVSSNRPGSGQYLALLYRLKKQVDIPIIGSLNGYTAGGWAYYSKLIASSGADALELNIYNMPVQTHVTSNEVEDSYLRLVESVCASVEIPVAVKISPYITALPHFIHRLAGTGAAGVVFFNRFYQPDIDLETETVVPNLQLSRSEELRLRLRWVAILHSRIPLDFGVTGGIHTGADAAKTFLVGGKVAMMASAILQEGVQHITLVRQQLEAWMTSKGYESLDQIYGKLDQKQVSNPTAYERANYLHVLDSFDTEETK